MVDFLKIQTAYLFLCQSENVKPAPILYVWHLDKFSLNGLTICRENRFLYFFRLRKVKEIQINPRSSNLVKTLIHEFTHQVNFLDTGFHKHSIKFQNTENIFYRRYSLVLTNIIYGQTAKN